MTDWNAVRARIRDLREAQGLTQADVGARVGSSANYVAQVEKGLPISEKKLARYAAALGATVPYLRYGVLDTIDAAALQARAFAAGRRSALDEMAAWLAGIRAADAGGAFAIRDGTAESEADDIPDHLSPIVATVTAKEEAEAAQKRRPGRKRHRRGQTG